ncbi:TPA: hypothetical protein [Thermocrinis Great Boiling Spring virus]|nr:TPA: hypothetical protein [Thermocrinis Great Boiling Spring virus]
MVQIGLSFKEALAHSIFAFLITFVFGLYGAVFVLGFVIGVEFMQACYRSFKYGYKWSNLWENPTIILRYLKPKDTAIDILTYAFGVGFAILVKGGV